jgi:murein L,D-transpeptidase YcbB/YkuD
MFERLQSMVLRYVLSAAVVAVLLSAPNGLAKESSSVTNPSINDHTVDPMMAAIRSVLGGAGKHGAFVDKRDTAAVAEYYAERGFEAAWTADGVLTERGRAIAQRLRDAAADGLDPRAYLTPPAHGFVDIRSLARADVMLSLSIVTYARHAYGGRVVPSKISSSIDYKPNVLDPVAVLSDVISADDPVTALGAYNPQHPEFEALRAHLATVRADRSELPPFIPAGKFMKLGSKDKRVIVLRERLKVTDLTGAPELFDEILDEAIRAYQETAALTVDGIVGPGTLASLNQAAQNREAIIVANMERWRWMPKDLGRLYVRVNVPNFNLDIYRDGEVYHTTRIVVGKPANKTPIFSDEIEHVIVNPTWNIPASIARNEFLPKLRKNRGSLNGYNVYANIKGRFRRVDPTFVNWSNVDMRKIQIKQPPGNRNALGQVKFMFPNKHAVYLHDTPSKSLFKKDYRAFSHGCMRVNNPWDFADALLEADPKITGDLVHKMVGGREQQLNLQQHIPVHVTYFTAWIDADGELQTRGDVYGHDGRLNKALGNS